MIFWVFAPYDLWIGAYYSRRDEKLYVLPVPMVGFCVDLKSIRKARLQRRCRRRGHARMVPFLLSSPAGHLGELLSCSRCGEVVEARGRQNCRSDQLH